MLLLHNVLILNNNKVNQSFMVPNNKESFNLCVPYFSISQKLEIY